jgi:hypothetical protein
MATYRVKAPDGTEFDITAPDGASQDEVMAYAKANMPTPEPKKPAETLTRGERIGMGLADPVHGGAQLLTKMLPEGVVNAGNRLNNLIADKTGLVAKLPEGGVDQQVRQREADYQAKRGEKGVDWWRLGGNIVSPVNLALGAAAPVNAAMKTKVAASALLGGASAGLEPVDSDAFWSTKGKQVGLGGAGGAAAPLVAGGLSRIVSPKASVNPDVELLKKSGVSPTIGQTLGGWANRFEEKAQSLPVVGDVIASARNRSREKFNQAAIERAVEPIGQKVSGVGQGAVAEAGNKLSDAYDVAKMALRNFQLDGQGSQELANLRRMAQKLPSKERASFNDVFKYVRGEISPNGSLTAEGFKKIDSKVGLEASRFSGSQDAYQQQLGDAFKELQRVLTDAAKRANPQAAGALENADKGWANLVRLEGASKAAKNSGGVFTPAQLNAAIQQADRSVRKRATARGEALMQDLGTAGQNVLGNKVADSGTAGRVFLGGGALGGAYLLDPTLAMGMGAGSLLYTPPAQALLRGLVSSRPKDAQKIAKLLEEAAPALGPGLGLLSLEVAP